MAKMPNPRFQVSITSDYCPTWGSWEVLREVVQNALDSQDDGYPMEVRRNGQRVEIESKGATLDQRAWLLGTTSKGGNKSAAALYRGKFGEGLKIAAMAAVRAGKPFCVRTATATHRATLEPFGWVEGADPVLTITLEKTQAEQSVIVVIDNVTDEEWTEARGRLLALEQPETMVGTTHGHLIGGPNYRGKVFVKGIFVADDQLAYGYDLAKAEVDRDRKMVVLDDARNAQARIWCETVRSWPDMAETHLIPMLETGNVDVDNLHKVAHWKTIALVAEKFHAKHGVDALPVRTEAEALEVGHYARLGVVVAPRYCDLLEKQLGTLRGHRAKYATSVARTYELLELSEQELDAFEEAVSLVEVAAAHLDLKPVTLRTHVVDFKSPTQNGLHQPDGKLSLARHLLKNPKELRRVLVHELAHDIALDGDKRHEVMEGRLHTEIEELLIENLAAEKYLNKDTESFGGSTALVVTDEEGIDP